MLNFEKLSIISENQMHINYMIMILTLFMQNNLEKTLKEQALQITLITIQERMNI